MAYCHIAHDCVVSDGCIFSNNSTLAGHVNVGKNVVMAGMVAVHQFVSIGHHSFVTGGALVRKMFLRLLRRLVNLFRLLE
jgi:UDP-N-acetylglucosamine acyltransferase